MIQHARRSNLRRKLNRFVAMTGLFAAFVVCNVPVYADQMLAVSHRIGYYTPARPNELTLELWISNLSQNNLQNIRLELTNADISPARSNLDMASVLFANDSTKIYWTLETPVSRAYVTSGSPLFIRGTAHSAGNESFEFTIVSTLKGE